MKGLKYQLKNIGRDKLCLISFLLPIIIGIMIRVFVGETILPPNESSFGIIQNQTDPEIIQWLGENGVVTEYVDTIQLEEAIIEPSTEMIGVLQAGDGIKTLIAGDEFSVNQLIANKLPDMYGNRMDLNKVDINILSSTPTIDLVKPLLIVLTMLTAMFMGCTFNSMNMIGEKEDGIELVNDILPLTYFDYLSQKIVIGVIGGVSSTIITGLICMPISMDNIIPYILLVFLSGFISAMIGLFIGEIAEGLMVGIVFLKMVMIFFIAPPLLFYLFAPDSSIIRSMSYLFPSIGTFYGLMDIITDQSQNIWINILVLFIHCLFWTLLFFIVRKLERFAPLKSVE
ncbi:ABC transporter permease [Amphibacillus sp. Q70]|uniref:ABC transporter permease n=1 Tax=Amphibacillus sp. Q70 TaxID=3453416 RepID=UPI003F84E39A